MRDLDPAILTALAAGALKERKFYTITAPLFSTGINGTAYFWNDLGPFTCDVLDGLTGLPVSRTFQGSGTLIGCGPIPLTADLNPRNVTISLNQVDDRVDSLVRGYNLKNAYCEIHSGLFDPSTHDMVAAAPCEFVGFVDGCTIKSPSSSQAGSVELRLVSHTRETTRAGYQTRSHVDQLQRNGSDNMFKFSAIMGSVQIFWYEKRLSASPTPSPAATANANTRLARASGFYPLTSHLF